MVGFPFSLRAKGAELLTEQCVQQRMRGARKRIDDCDSSPDKPVLHIFGEKEPAIGLGGSAENDRIPYAELAGCQIGGSQQN